MRRRWFIAALAVGLAAGGPAMACRIYRPIDLGDVAQADVVVVGRISGYRVVRDKGPDVLLSDYARFSIQVDEVLAGEAPARVTVTWDNSTFAEPEAMAAGPYLIALRKPSAEAPPQGDEVRAGGDPEPKAFTLLQAPCAAPFLFDLASDEARAVRRRLAASR